MFKLIGSLLFVFLLTGFASAQPLLSPDESLLWGQTLEQNYQSLLDTLNANPNVVTTVDGALWVPWFSSSSSCQISDLRKGNSCNSGQAIDFQHHCMVSDELSQVAILVSMDDESTRMNQLLKTLDITKSNNGVLPSWRVYRDGNTIEPCRAGINANCDTASDATARFIIALFTASQNPAFSQSERVEYESRAREMSEDFLTYEVINDCRPSSLGHGDICFWLAAGSGARSGGLESWQFAYTGYYADAIIAMLQACAITEDDRYCHVAGNFTLNYLQAAYPPGTSIADGFRVPPGKSFKWDASSSDIPIPYCTDTCYPAMWDNSDAPRAFGMCQAQYYSDLVGVELPHLAQYCAVWKQEHLLEPNRAMVQYFPDGSGASKIQSGYLAQGLQSFVLLGTKDVTLLTPTLVSALKHYIPSKKTWDYTACFGVYNQAFPMRALATSIGLDEQAFPPISKITEPPVEEIPPAVNETNKTQEPLPPAQPIAIANSAPSAQEITVAEMNAQAFSVTLSNPDALPVAFSWIINDVLTSTSSSLTLPGNETAQGTYLVRFIAEATTNIVAREWTLIRLDTPPPPPSPLPEQTMTLRTLPFTCTVSSSGCTKTSDITSGTCRTIVASTNSGTIKIQACEKAGRFVEIYRQQMPSRDFTACLGAGCVNRQWGFARFQM